jgi:hypothetical protein
MDVLLLILMLASLAAAAAFAVIAWRVVREERARSAARIASLSDVLDGEGRPEGRPLHTPRGMFERPTTVKGRPMLKAAVVGTLAIIVVVVAAMGRSDSPDAREGTAATQQEAGAPAHGAPLELMSMRHERDGGTLTVTGLVRNPPNGSEARRVTAVVFAFDRTGAFVGSGRAPLDFVVLQPDDESPFVVTLPNMSDVARYRVSFRTEAGLLRHLDRRATQLQIAGNR